MTGTIERLHPSRERLPNRRASIAFDFELGGIEFTCTYSTMPDGRLGEIFLNAHKAGSQTDIAARDNAIAASLALQYGTPAEVLQHAVSRNSDGSANGPLGAALDKITTALVTSETRP